METIGNFNRFHLRWCTTIGSSHKSSGRESQDWLEARCEPDGSSAAVAVSDGHGGEKYIRSEIGSRFAAEVLLQLFCSLSSMINLTTPPLRKEIELNLPSRIVSNWRERVREHIKQFPVDGNNDQDKYILYGCTLAGALFTQSYILYVILGDCDILAVSHDYKVTDILASAEITIGEETESLCSNDAANHIRIKMVSALNDLPSMVLVCTDGYSKSFVTRSGFYKAAEDYLKMYRDGKRLDNELICKHISEVSRLGSGDDVSLALIFNDVTKAQNEEKQR